jgi:osmotically-inducible protein OsmY
MLVGVSEGVLTLTGFVDTYAEKLAAEKAIKRVRGVRGVANDLVVRPFSQPTDTDIVKTALHALESDVRVPAAQIIVTVKDGIVTLDGEVEWAHQKDATEAALEHLLGVRGILNQITVKPAVSPTEVKQKIIAALGRSALFGEDRIVVEAADGKVTLAPRPAHRRQLRSNAVFEFTTVCEITRPCRRTKTEQVVEMGRISPGASKHAPACSRARNRNGLHP